MNVMKKNLSIILSLVALVGVISVWVLWCLSVIDFAVVTTDTFIGAMTGILGLLITFVVGWQIVNVLEIKDRMQKVSQLEKQLSSLKEATILLNYNMQSQISYSNGEMREKEKDYDIAFVAYNIAFKYAILAESQSLGVYITLLTRVVCLIQDIGAMQVDLIKKDADVIRDTDAYLQYFKKEYDSIINNVLSKPVRNE
jgi:sorbitol-specific phosphotransferase system component IIC